MSPQLLDSGQAKGCLYLVPTPLDFGCAQDLQCPIEHVLPGHTLRVAASLQHWVAENAKSTRGFLKRVNTHTRLKKPIQELSLVELPRDAHKKGDYFGSPGAAFDARPLLAPAVMGQDMGLTSEAGMPAVADPGSSLVRAAHILGIEVKVLVGPISLILALAASGLNGQQFAFLGYLPQDDVVRSTRLKELEALAIKTGQTQIFIETPYRNSVLLKALMKHLQPSTRLAVSCGLGLLSSGHAVNFSGPISEWRNKHPALNLALPAVFLFGP